MSSFWTIVGPPENRQLIGNDYNPLSKEDHVIWRDAASGDEIVITGPLDGRHNGSIVAPGFKERFYYTAWERELIIELKPEARK